MGEKKKKNDAPHTQKEIKNVNVYLLDCEGSDDILCEGFRFYKRHLDVSVHFGLIWPITNTLYL